VLGAWNAQRELDEVIARFSKNWKLTRIAKVELTILRLAMHEILHRQDIPLRVAINEAVELAKTYGDDNSPTFVNGILDAVARAVDNGEFTIRKGL
jgi:N utilization substance protein B